MIKILIISSLLCLGSAWNQPSTCYVRSSCSSNSEVQEDIQELRSYLESSLASHAEDTQELRSYLESSLASISDNSEVHAEDIHELRSYLESSLASISDNSDVHAEDIHELRSYLESSLASHAEDTQELRSYLESSLASHAEDTQELRSYLESSLASHAEDTQELRSYLATSLASINSTLEQLFHFVIPIGTFENPASSCSAISQDRPSGMYWLTTNNGPIQVYCDTNPTSCSCSTTGGWMRVANFDMTNPNENCPNGFRLVTRDEPPLRSCGSFGGGCVSTTYPVNGVSYSQVCGRVVAYQDKLTDAFNRFFITPGITIDDAYVDGVSLTHGQSPRQHIWTFASALDELRSNQVVCPCTTDQPFTGILPPFVGNDYFCDTGSRDHFQHIFYADDPLWDGQGCGGTSTCCQFNNPPWFCKQLPEPTTDDIELRLCSDESLQDENSPIEIVEMFVR